MKKGLVFVLFIISIFAINFIVATEIGNSLHLNIQTTDASGVVTGTFNFGFNISTSSDCAAANVVYADAASLTTNSQGIISHYLDNVDLNFSEQYWLCYYRDNVLISASKIARIPYSFTTKKAYNLTINGGWENNGVSILGGDIFAQTLYVYNLSSLSVNNLHINGSLLPPVGWDNQFDIGSGSLRWKDFYLGGQVYSNGTGANYLLGDVNIGSNNIISLDKDNGVITGGYLLHLSSAAPVELWLDQTGSGNTDRKISSSGGSMIFYSDATEHARIDSAGRVGIGTSIPSYALEVANSAKALNVSGVLYVNGTSGNIGIGTNSPTHKLNVVGDLNVTGTAYIGDLDLSGSNVVFNSLNVTKKVNLSSVLYTDPVNGRVGIGTSNPSQKLEVDGYILSNNFNATGYLTTVGISAGVLNTGDYITAIGYEAGYSNTGEHMTAIGYEAGYSNTGIHMTAIGYDAGNGNVGNYSTIIGYLAGFNNKGNRLTAIGYFAGQGNIGNYLTAVGFQAGDLNTGNFSTALGYSALRSNKGNNVVAIGYEAGINNLVSDQFIVKQANVNAVPLIQGNFSSGFVGINTTTPTHTLNVVGNVNVTGTAYIGDLDLSGSNVVFNSLNVTKKVNLSSVLYTDPVNGRVGIGITAPAYSLEIVKSATALNVSGFLYANSTNVGIGTATPAYALEVANNARAMNISGVLYVNGTSGNVGIGTASPGASLHVDSGDATYGLGTAISAMFGLDTADRTGAIKLWGTTDGAYGLIQATTSNLHIDAVGGSTYLNYYDGDNVYFGTGAGATIGIWGSDGKVGIGTTSPAYLLEIAKSSVALNVSGNLYTNTSGINIASAITTGNWSTPHTWNHFGTGVKDNAQITDVNDVYISDDLEVDGQAFIGTTNTTTGTYWNVGDLAEILTTINGRNAWLCKGKPNCIAYSKDELDFGDVVCIDTRYGQVITICNSSNSHLVAGVVSNTALINIAGDIEYGYPVSIAGLVNTKVSNENGGILPGDLLVSASKPGYAMKAPEDYKIGTILGKAFDFCDTRYYDECVIPMFVALG